MSRFSADEKRREIEREIAMRNAVYPKWIAAGKLKQEKADLQVEIMREIADDYRRITRLDLGH